MLSEPHLARRPANHQPLTPVDLLARSLEAFPEKTAVVAGDRSWSYREFDALVRRMTSRLMGLGVKAGDVVSIMSANRPEMLAAHYAVPMIGAVLNAINVRLDADTVGYILEHSGSRFIVTDHVCEAVARDAAGRAGVPVLPLAAGSEGALAGLLEDRSEAPAVVPSVTDEWQAICINYTSGTTGRPKGVVYHHRGAYLNALGNVITLGLDQRTVYLWTLPMFHCNGWCHTWAVTAAGGVHVCLERPDPALVFEALQQHPITHFACAPVVLYMLLNHPERRPARSRVKVATGGAAPTATLIAELGELGFDLMHLYGLTESYGPATLCELGDTEGLDPKEKARLLSRQGLRHVTASHVRVLDTEGHDVPRDGATLGEIALAGNTLMAGYYKDSAATEKAFAGGRFHTGDLAVMHENGHIEIRDRAKDIIISGGENISSLEVESVLHQHPAVLLAAVVAGPDPKWGEIPCAFLELRAGMSADPEELRHFCRERLAHFKVPRLFLFQELPKTSTGKIQKFVLREAATREISAS
ncbi:MAG: AMP-binding protein [Hyphomicrobiaceae bacterium]